MLIKTRTMRQGIRSLYLAACEWKQTLEDRSEGAVGLELLGRLMETDDAWKRQ